MALPAPTAPAAQLDEQPHWSWREREISSTVSHGRRASIPCMAVSPDPFRVQNQQTKSRDLHSSDLLADPGPETCSAPHSSGLPYPQWRSMTWQECVERVKPHVVRLATPTGHGTGFLAYRRDRWVAVATARHVVAHAHEWELPIKIHWKNLDPITVTPQGRVLRVHPERDSAVLAWVSDESVARSLPRKPLPLLGDESFVRTGVTIGWLGYPHLVEGGTRCCFFSGAVSDLIDHRYFVDGVAIHGVSGGPAFCPDKDGNVTIIGSISEYRPNRLGGETLPGLLVVDDLFASNVLRAAADKLLSQVPTD